VRNIETVANLQLPILGIGNIFSIRVTVALYAMHSNASARLNTVILDAAR